ncbi:hypothetical protein K469DRAFT_361013 [Zopfia rhizophila CBS 207.26]|uniref:Uncharacterized protein n=1 Tax=Zopfia rhizophila CBS 207.26 TaxID=1314779 RepID=A0A6A6EHT2_9PEZI|nr:hypothetical protein K469DRAFT_361013 [Zopfia rhizophila CBS 207.26]
MLPPRLKLPLRPCHPSWSTIQVCWASDVPGDSPQIKLGRRRQTLVAGRISAQASSDVPKINIATAPSISTSTDTPKDQKQEPTTTKTRWWKPIWGNISSSDLEQPAASMSNGQQGSSVVEIGAREPTNTDKTSHSASLKIRRYASVKGSAPPRKRIGKPVSGIGSLTRMKQRSVECSRLDQFRKDKDTVEKQRSHIARKHRRELTTRGHSSRDTERELRRLRQKVQRMQLALDSKSLKLKSMQRDLAVPSEKPPPTRRRRGARKREKAENEEPQADLRQHATVDTQRFPKESDPQPVPEKPNVMSPARAQNEYLLREISKARNTDKKNETPTDGRHPRDTIQTHLLQEPGVQVTTNSKGHRVSRRPHAARKVAVSIPTHANKESRIRNVQSQKPIIRSIESDAKSESETWWLDLMRRKASGRARLQRLEIQHGHQRQLEFSTSTLPANATRTDSDRYKKSSLRTADPAQELNFKASSQLGEATDSQEGRTQTLNGHQEKPNLRIMRSSAVEQPGRPKAAKNTSAERTPEIDFANKTALNDPSTKGTSTKETQKDEPPAREVLTESAPEKEASTDESPEWSDQSLLEELFPEASTYIQPHTPIPQRKSYPKLSLPDENPIIRKQVSTPQKSRRQRILESFQNRGEDITVLQLINCSTELSESDFRRLLPKGKHIESWVRDGEFYNIIPGRDPVSLERLPFYYLLFWTPASALAYQNNAARLHKLTALHQPSSIFSAIPPPKGFLEDGEDINAAMSNYVLKPTNLKFNLNMVMQPYTPTLRALIEQGGYKPIVPSVSDDGKQVWKVLLHIEGYEPSQMDLYHTLFRDGYNRGITWPFQNGAKGIHKLRDLVDFKRRLKSSDTRPSGRILDQQFDDWNAFNGLSPTPDYADERSVNQLLMYRLYNRWIIEFEDKDYAMRFARMYHRRVLPRPREDFMTWRDTEEVRTCNAEFLW